MFGKKTGPENRVKKFVKEVVQNAFEAGYRKAQIDMGKFIVDKEPGADDMKAILRQIDSL